MLKVFGMLQSGNCFKVKMLLTFLGIEHEWINTDVMKGESRTPEFLAMNPNGKIPSVLLEDGRVLSESNAILGYFAEDTPFLPSDRYTKAKVYEWLFFEQYSHEPKIAVARFIKVFQNMPEARKAEYEKLFEGGYKALDLMEATLSKQDYLVGDSLTIADICLYGYTHVADEGGFDMSRYPGIRAWCERIASREGYRDMNDQPRS
ncbi:glutathione S-transferase family protein [Pokkaliibacter sp. CJK22405]|uniref:glutathione S-transferase family protein n=1 Tax=Pokkaliibacter sp. CJK22405 TaxID=3384615 RepID=UPI003984B899